MNIVSEGVYENTYVTRKTLTDMSLVLFDGDEPWAKLGSAIRFYCDKNKIKDDKFKKIISLKDIQAAIDEYSKETGDDRVIASDYFTKFSLDDILVASEKYDL
ncbi:MAG: hypothetical protein J5903_02800, partial [Clostridia bacterium]|nr:hypothetical protein [Clostridia bacterium]